jgi:hypothetical protein
MDTTTLLIILIVLVIVLGGGLVRPRALVLERAPPKAAYLSRYSCHKAPHQGGAAVQRFA